MCPRCWIQPLAGALLLLAALSCGSRPSPRPDHAAPEAPRAQVSRAEPVDAEHYFLDLELDPEGRALRGACTVQLVATAERVLAFELDLEGLDVEAVRDADGRPLAFEQRGARLRIVPFEPLARGARLEVSITYGGRPHGGLWYTAERDGVPTQAFTQGECEDARRWFPCIDSPADRATSELRVRLPAGWIAVAAGERIDLYEEGGRRVEHWRMSTPHPAYLVTLVAGELAELEDDFGDLPLHFLAEERLIERAPQAFEETGAALAFLEELTGRRYPYVKYSQACVSGFPFGGMENVSASTLTDATLSDERAMRDSTPVGLVVHELAHQWFGNLLTCRDWSHVWLNEGFATYAALLYLERTRGVDEFRARLRDTQEGYLEGDVGEARRAIVHGTWREPLDLFFGGHTYQGGASRLHLLRHELGDAAFFEGVRRYVAEGAGRGVVTDDLRRAMEDASGRDLTGFFQQWLHSPGYPEFLARWSFSAQSRELRLWIDQIHELARGTPPAFRVSMDVEVRTASGTTLRRLDVDRRRKRYTLSLDEEPLWVRFDKHGAIPARIRVLRKDAEWLAIAAEDDDVNGRRAALAALGRAIPARRSAEDRESLLAAVLRRLREDPVDAVRVAAARALGVAGGPEARFQLARAASSDPAAAVRVAALEELRAYGADPALRDLARECFDAGYSYRTMIAAAGLYASADAEGAWEWLREGLALESPNDRLRAGLIGVLAGLQHPLLAAELRRIATSPELGEAARAAAAQGLGRPGRGERETRALLGELVSAPELRVRQAAVQALAQLRDPTAARELQTGYDATVLPFERRAIERALQALAR